MPAARGRTRAKPGTRAGQRRSGQRAPKPAKTRTPIWLWLLSGVVMGSVLAVVVFFVDTSRPNKQAAAKHPSAAPAATRKLSPTDYQLGDLYRVPAQAPARAAEPATVAEVPAATARAPDNSTTPTVADKKARPKTSIDRRYWLQAGAFRSQAQADGLKARLVLSGLPVQVFRARVKGQQWFRVRVGPYRDTAALDKGKSRLRSQKINKPAVIREHG